MNLQPLAGRTILVTRARHQAGRLGEELRSLGAEVLEIPAIEIAPPQSWEPLDRALTLLSRYQWLIVTSANAVDSLRTRAAALGLTAADFAHLRIAAVGSATARALRKFAIEPTITPQEYVAESLLDAIGDQVTGQRVLLARAAIARDVIPDALRARKAEVDVIEAYRTVIPAESVTAIRAIFADCEKSPDAATFTSSSTVTNFFALCAQAGVEAPSKLRAISIGPITSRTLRENRWEPAAEANPHDLDGLIAAIVKAFQAS